MLCLVRNKIRFRGERHPFHELRETREALIYASCQQARLVEAISRPHLRKQPTQAIELGHG